MATCTLLALWLFPARASAYPWMIRHHYVSCSACHHDPSGAGLLTAYGRVTANDVLQMRSASEGTEQFLLGAVTTPEWLDLGGDARVMYLNSKTSGTPRADSRMIWMQLDGEASLTLGNFVASGSLGFAPEGALGAALTRDTANNLVSRQHWLGYQARDGYELLIRAGRMNLPFGIRNVEHTLWARKLTRTSINDDQQFGLSGYFGTDNLRGELMAILGNFQLRPDRYRERGYSAYLEYQPASGLALGVSSLLTHRSLDTIVLKETWRQVHGAFGRWATPYEPLVLLSEWDYIFESSRDTFYTRGLAGYLQADLELTRGVHLLATGEANKVGRRPTRAWSWSGWLSYAWFFAPHADLRLDAIFQSLGAGDDRAGVTTLLLQGHVYL